MADYSLGSFQSLLFGDGVSADFDVHHNLGDGRFLVSAVVGDQIGKGEAYPYLHEYRVPGYLDDTPNKTVVKLGFVPWAGVPISVTVYQVPHRTHSKLVWSNLGKGSLDG